MIQEWQSGPGWMIRFDLGLFYAIELSLGGHTDTYRTVPTQHGAFELCRPSLRIFYHNCLLRPTISYRSGRAPRWGPFGQHGDLEQYEVSHLVGRS